VEITGDPADPESRAELTLRAEHMRDILSAPDRLRHPLKRVGHRGANRWESVSWDEALGAIAIRRLRRTPA
jgi:anaerobic selenocysteine-containing dehydrogenase